MTRGTILVTGAAGYIGSVLTPKLLDAGYRVRAVDRFFFGPTLPEREGLDLVRDDIRWMSPSNVDGVDAVIDLAALSNDPAGEMDPDKTWEINHAGRVRVAHLAKEAGVKRYILPSSCSIYGIQEGLVDERSPVNPLTTYAKANLEAERDILPLNDDDFTVVILRQATVYGLSPRMRFDLAINGMTKGMYQDGRIPILRDGTQWRPFVHVQDTTKAMLLCLEADKETVSGQIFNVGADEQNVQVLPLAETVADALEVPFEFDWYGSPDHRSYRVSFAKIKKTLGFEVDHSPGDGAREIHAAMRSGEADPSDPRTITVDWYRRLTEDRDLQESVAINGKFL